MASEAWAVAALKPPPDLPLRVRRIGRRHVWLVSRIPVSDRADNEPVVVVTTKAAARQWVKTNHPELVLSGDDGSGHFVARTTGSDWITRFDIQKVPFGADAGVSDGE